MKKHLFIVVLAGYFFVPGLLPALTKTQADRLFEKARILETTGDLIQAEQFYDSLFTAFPNNSQYAARYKSLLIRSGKLDKAMIITEYQFERNSGNPNLAAELGVLMIANNLETDAYRMWEHLLRDRNMRSRIPQTAIMYLTAYYGGNGLPDMMKFFRTQLREPLLQSQTYFSNLISRQMWKPALEEYLLHRKISPHSLKPLTREIYSLDPSSPLYAMLIDSLEITAETEEDFILLSDLYFTAERYAQAINILFSNIPPVQIEYILTLAKKLADNKEYTMSLTVLDSLTLFSDSERFLYDVQFMKAINHEALASEINEKGPKLIKPYQNEFLQIPVKYSFSNQNLHHLNSARELFEKLSDNKIPEKYRFEARFRLSEILLFGHGDVDGAEKLLTEIPPTLPESLRNHMLKRAVDCKIMRSDLHGAEELIRGAPVKYKLSAREEDRLRLNLITIDLAFNRIDSLEKHIHESLTLTESKDDTANDLLALAIYLQTASEKPELIALEQSIRKANWPELLKEAEKLMQEKEPVRSLAAMRAESVLYQTKQMAGLEEFWSEYRHILKKDQYLGDYFSIRYAMYLERINDNENARQEYRTFLTDHPESPYLETVRDYIRQ